MRIAVAGDHAGFDLKQALVKELKTKGYEVDDLGALTCDPLDDYPDFAVLVGDALREERADRGLLICGSGVGVCVAANKIPGVRAGICHDTYSAGQGVEHDDMNVLCIGARVVGSAVATAIVESFLQAEFSAKEERHLRRYNKVLGIEKQYLR